MRTVRRTLEKFSKKNRLVFENKKNVVTKRKEDYDKKLLKAYSLSKWPPLP